MFDSSHLPIDQQIELTMEEIKLSEAHIKHYSSNPIKLNEFFHKNQMQALVKHNKELYKHLEKLINKQI